jgi:hypothetical protein
VPVDDGVAEVEGRVGLAEEVADPVAGPDGVPEVEAPLDGLAVGESVRLPEVEGVGDRLVDCVPELVGVTDRVADAVPVPVGDHVEVAVTDANKREVLARECGHVLLGSRAVAWEALHAGEREIVCYE